MKAAGIIAEYNPFHKGHELHIKETKSKLGADFIVVAMSGNFVQRGEPAIFDKYSRAEAALRSGADLVVEIPAVFSSAGAEFFAHSGVKLLADMGVVDYLSFGSESGEICKLKPAAEILANEPEKYKLSLKKYLNEGISFPAARMKAVGDCGIDGEILNEPNNILGVEYMKALIRLKSKIIPFTVKRQGNGYNSESEKGRYLSASALRKMIYEGKNIEDAVPQSASEIYKRETDKGKGPVFLKDVESFLNFEERRLGKENLKSIEDVTEGLENKIVLSPWDIEEKIEFLKSKRYTRTKIQRMLLHVLLGIEKEYAEKCREMGYIPYIKVLGFKRSAEKLLEMIKISSKLPLIVNLRDVKKFSNEYVQEFFGNEMKYDDFYNALCPNKNLRGIGNDYKRKVLKML